MDERDKIKFRIELGIQDHGEIFHRELIKALKREKNRFSTEEMDKTLVDCIADALIAANIGDITAWKERAEKAENALRKGVKCISSSPTAGFVFNPLDMIHDNIKCITIAQRALENIVKQYWCDNRGCNECEEKQCCIEGICSRYIQQAECEIEKEGKDE